MYLIDTNVISEVRKDVKANSGVQKFFNTTDAADIYLSRNVSVKVCAGSRISGIAATFRKPNGWRNGSIWSLLIMPIEYYLSTKYAPKYGGD